MIASPSRLLQAAAHLHAADSKLAPYIDRSGICTITPHTNYYQSLVDSIIGQQLSVKAARSIRERFYIRYGKNTLLAPEEILSSSVDDLRAVGLSGAKARYVQDLAQHVLDGRLTFDRIEQLTNDEVIAMLTAVKGIGEWTAHMFMMFCMGRLDVLPVGDLGVKNGMKILYGLDAVPTPDEMRVIAVKFNWHPYESVASWYVWQSLDIIP